MSTKYQKGKEIDIKHFGKCKVIKVKVVNNEKWIILDRAGEVFILPEKRVVIKESEKELVK